MLLPVTTAFIATLVLVPVVRQFCIRWNIYDPTGPLKIHSQPIPRLGGVAITLAFGAAISFAGHLFWIHFWPFLAALALIWTAGLADDIWLLPPVSRLVAQIGGAALLWMGGWRFPWIMSNPANLAAVCFLTVLIINSFNFLDGSDGLCAGVTGTIAVAYLIIPGFTLSFLGTTVAWSLLGVSAGFLVFNFPPSRGIFMGDSGSTVLGFGVAFLAFDFYRANTANDRYTSILVPLMMAALPLLDGILTVLRRLRGGDSPLHGDRLHFYDLLLGLGWSSQRVALTIYAVTGAMCFVAWLVLQSDFTRALLLCVASTGAFVAVAVRLGSLQSNERAISQFGAAQSRQFRKLLRKILP